MKLPNACVALVCSLALLAGPAYALETEPLDLNGVPGVWIERSDAERTLHALEKIPGYKDLIDTQGELIKSQRDQVKTATIALEVLADGLVRDGEVIDHWREAYNTSLDQRDSIWNEPVLWLVIGTLLGGGVAGAAAWAAK